MTWWCGATNLSQSCGPWKLSRVRATCSGVHEGCPLGEAALNTVGGFLRTAVSLVRSFAAHMAYNSWLHHLRLLAWPCKTKRPPVTALALVVSGHVAFDRRCAISTVDPGTSNEARDAGGAFLSWLKTAACWPDVWLGRLLTALMPVRCCSTVLASSSMTGQCVALVSDSISAIAGPKGSIGQSRS